MDVMGGSKSVPHLDVPMAVVVWVQLVTMCLWGWTSESVAMWQELTGYRLEKASHCKDTNTCNEHEFIIYEFINDRNRKLQLRSDRAAGKRKDTTTLPSSPSSVESLGTNLEKPSSPLADSTNSQSSRSSLSLVSVPGSLSKISGSIRHAVRRLSDSPLSVHSAISSNRCLAADTITRINGHPPHSRVLRTLTFNGDRSSRPSLWDIMILVNVVHQDSTTYTLFERQCFWFADTIFASLEKWAKIYEVESVKGKEKKKWGRRRSSTGSLCGVLVHRRDSVHIDMIWEDFTKERQIMNEQREGYERARAEEIRKAEELAGQVEELKQEQVREREGREKERRERSEMERRMRKEQQDRERQLKRDEEERERRLRTEQDERERRHREEQRLLKQQIADQQRQLQEKDRQWEIRLQQKEEKTERRFQQMEERIIRMSGNQIDLNPSPSA